MPTAVSEPTFQTVPQEPPRKRWTRQECLALEATGLFDQQHLELVEGELINKMGKKRPHINVARFVLIWLHSLFGPEFVDQEATIDVAPQDNPTSEPEPDLVLLARSGWEFDEHNPRPDDIRLVVEVSDSSLGFDLKTKAGLYARAGIPEYWVFDIAGARLIVHREPAEGRYGSIAAYSGDEMVAPLAAPQAMFAVGQAFRKQRSF